MAGLEGGLARVFDELADLRDKARTHKKDLSKRDQHIEKLEGDVKLLEDRCLTQEKENGALRTEVEQLKAELQASQITLEGKDAFISSLEEKLGEAQRSNKALTQDVGRLRDDYQLAELKLAEARKHHQRADAKAVAAYKKSPDFHEDAADLFGGEMVKLLGVFAEELKLRVPEANPRDFVILRSLFEDAGEGPHTEGEEPQDEGKGPDGETQGEDPKTGGQGDGQSGGGAGAEGEHGEAGAGDGNQA